MPRTEISRYIVRRTAYGFVAYDVDQQVNVGREVRSRKSASARVDKLNAK